MTNLCLSITFRGEGDFRIVEVVRRIYTAVEMIHFVPVSGEWEEGKFIRLISPLWRDDCDVKELFKVSRYLSEIGTAATCTFSTSFDLQSSMNEWNIIQ